MVKFATDFEEEGQTPYTRVINTYDPNQRMGKIVLEDLALNPVRC